jgi:hypothetical protein
VTFPVTLTIERSGTTMTTSAVDAAKAVLDLGTNTLVPPVDFMVPRIFFLDSLEGVSVPGSSMTVSLIEISGDLVPDVNLPPAVPTATITTTTDDEEPFTSGEAVWSVDFGRDVDNVDDTDFVVETTGDVQADDPTVDAPLTGSVFTVRSANVSGTEGDLRLALSGSHNIAASDDAAAAVEGQSQAYRIGISVPVAGLLGLGLVAGAIAALGASAARRQKK